MAALSTNATPPSNGSKATFEIQGQSATQNLPSRLNFVSPEYFPVLRIPVTQGRIWNNDENQHGALVAVVNETFARRYFPNGDALGHLLKVQDMQEEAPYNLIAPGAKGWLLIVGVIADKRTTDWQNRFFRKPSFPTRSACACGHRFWYAPRFHRSPCFMRSRPGSTPSITISRRKARLKTWSTGL
jgi:hypothetical protein